MHWIRGVIFVSAIFLLSFLPVQSHAANSYPIEGTWELDVANSVMPHPVPKSEILHIGTHNGMITADLDEITADGRHVVARSTLELDGKAYRVRGSAPYGADTINAEQTRDHITEATLRKHGNVVANVRALVDPAGQMATITVVAKERGKKNLNETTVWSRCSSGTCGTQG